MPDASLPFSRRLATALYAAALLVTAPPGALAQSAPEPAAIGFDVPAGDLAPALRALASQAGIMLTFTPEQTAGKTTAGLKGRYGIEEAFARLLAGSQLQATRQSAGGYILRAAEAATLSAIRITGNAAEPPSQDTGAYTAGSSKGATGLSLSLRETPQSVSIITRQQMSDFQLNNINQVLDATPGVVVERVETDRSYYTARGFN
ncbi:secretin and TonB N-terminal domain-containing protein, partial [Bordetella hinzii]|nr:secretin and TonB N-terminal domain-containing protein [Bordetella hinzii]